MKSLVLAASVLILAPQVLGETADFDTDAMGEPPRGWVCGTTGAGSPHWVVEEDSSAPSRPRVLKQGTATPFLWCVRSNSAAENGSVEVKFKPSSGKDDQAGGVVWRWKDGKNYYVARADALERKISLSYTVNGLRKTIRYVDAPVALNAWHTLKVSYRGDDINVSLNGKTYIEANDRNISGSGKVGVWTKADSVTLFDDFAYSNAVR
jgi:hypothetical protein